MPLIGYKIIILLILTAWVAWAGYDYGYDRGADKVQAEYDKYKGEVNEQISKAKIANAATEAAQDAKFKFAKDSYSSDVARLNIALQRMSGTKIVPRDSALSVAGVCANNVSGEAKNPCGIAIPFVTWGGTFSSFESFYESALKDTLQCQRLIEFLK